MRLSVLLLAGALLGAGADAKATVFTFDTDPFAGSDALTTPGRQIVGNEFFIAFDPATDKFAFDLGVFGLDELLFAGVQIDDIPASGANTIVLLTTPVPFAAGLAANEIAARVTDPGPGFFVYFNSGLDPPRLVYSTDLSDSTADLKVLARMTNLAGDPGRAALGDFTADNFVAVVAEPSAWPVALAGCALAVCVGWRRRRGAAAAPTPA